MNPTSKAIDGVVRTTVILQIIVLGGLIGAFIGFMARVMPMATTMHRCCDQIQGVAENLPSVVRSPKNCHCGKCACCPCDERKD